MLTTTKRKPKTNHKPLIFTAPDHRAVLARRLDLIADCELQQGHVQRAEYLARQAAELRGAA